MIDQGTHSLQLAFGALAALLCGCGTDAGKLEVRATLAATTLTAGDIQSMDVFVLVNQTSDGVTLSCADLLSAPIVDRHDLVTLYHQFLAFASAKLETIPNGSSLLVAIDAYSSVDGTGRRIAAACAEGVEIKPGETTDLALVLSATP